MIIGAINRHLRLIKAKRKWRAKNTHNSTYVNSVFNQDLCTVGNYTYGNVKIYSTNNISRLLIGSFCSIGENVKFILNDEHPLNYLTTFPVKKRLFNGPPESISKGNIVVEDDVWFGNDVIVMSGIRIGQGAVIAAGAVVTKDVPPYAIIGGVPAKVIKYRFSEEVIQKLVKIDFSSLSKEEISKKLDSFYADIDSSFDFLQFPQKEI